MNIYGSPATIRGCLQAGGESTIVNSLNRTNIDSSAIDILRVLRGTGKTFYLHMDKDVDLEAMANMIDERISGLTWK